MRIAYFDCFSGASGDMILGALLDAGVSLAALKRELAKLGVSGYGLRAWPELKQGIRGKRVEVKIREEGIERKLKDFENIIKKSHLSDSVKRDSLLVFRRLAEAEARVHGTTADRVHFHEVGGLDTLIDVVGSLVGLELLGVAQVCSSPLPMGSGFIKCSHGTLPVPAPATAELCRGFPTYSRVEQTGELTTPTGAAILTTIGKCFGSLPQMSVGSVGYGAGAADWSHPNLLRLYVGEKTPATGAEGLEPAFLLETNIDDMNPELFENVLERLFAAGVLDAFLVPIMMKKTRPATMISVLVRSDLVPQAVAILFAETTTLGVRIQEVRRQCLSRDTLRVRTRYGPVKVKIGKWNGKVVTSSPEYEDCKRLANERAVAVKKVWAEALAKASRLRG